jgi:two-component sensor histidine kinase
VGLTARREPAMKPYAKALSDRIAALGRAHEFARPHSEASRPASANATLLDMLRELLSPYPAMQDGRLTISGDDAPIDDRGATPIALVVHELATNAAKYGALSTETGRVDVACRRQGDHLTLHWRERGGPPIAGPPTHQGFGAQLASMSVEQQLGGRLTRTWAPEGLILDLEVKLSRLSRDS